MSKRIALVTGSSRGIGATIARRLAREGAEVWLAARSADRCAEVASAIEAAGGVARTAELDVSDPTSVRSLAQTIGTLDWLVNNAGIAESAPLPTRESADMEELVQRHMEVNFHGARRVMEAFLPSMVERGGGHVVNVASSAALRGYPYVSAYCASKHALLGYSRAAALELASKEVRVDVVCPHYVESPMLEASIRKLVETVGMEEEAAREFFRKQNPGGRLVRPADVAEEVVKLFLEPRTGRVVELDGTKVNHLS